MKKMFSLALALIMALALSIPAFAEGDAPAATKTIKVENSVEGETYSAYKVFDLTKTATADENGGYAYTIEEGAMFDLVLGYMEATKTEGETKYVGEGLTLTKSTEGNKWNVAHSGFNAVAFAEYLNDADKKDLTAVDTQEAGAKGVELTVTDTGYYFVDSTLGALCALDTADTVTVYEKNSIPTITKWVDEDDKDANAILGNDEWQKTADADYGQTVNYLLVVNTGTNDKNGEQTSAGADEVYEIVDTIPADLCFNNDIVIKYDDGTPVEAAKYTVDAAVNEDNETVVTITLDAKGADEDTNFNIYYSVKVGPVAAGVAHTNTAVLTYQEQTSQDSATLYTWAIPVFKYTGTDTPLADATFEVKNEAGDVLKFDAVDGNTYIYNAKGAVEKITTDESGKFTIVGLDSDVYTLTETKAPAGYNALTAPITMKIEAAEAIDGEYTGEYQVYVYDSEAQMFVESDTVNVLNNTGTELPSTGGVGTTIFYTVGGLMMAAAVVLFVTKKKLAVQE